MKKNKGLLFLVLATIIACLTSSTAINFCQNDYWPLKKIEIFFMDPIKNFESLKQEENLRDKIDLFIRFNLDMAKKGLRALTDKPDERKAEILIFLLSVYPEYIIADEGARMFCQYPELFVKKLKSCSDWKTIINELSKREDFYCPAIGRLNGSEFEKEVRQFVISLYQKRQHEMNLIATFIEDPVGKFGEIKRLDDIGFLIYQYERKFVKDGVLIESPVESLLEKLGVADEETIQVLIFLVLNIKTGINAELVVDKATGIFKDNPNIFLSVLENECHWKSVVKSMYLFDPDRVSEGFKKVKETEFITEVKKYIKEIEK